MNATSLPAEPRKQVFLKPPRYVLLSDKQRIGPTVTDNRQTAHSTVIYGFSDAPIYKEFMANSGVPLMPYPLVKTYLREQLSDLDGETEAVKLVVIDAVSPVEPSINAVTMQAVLSAFEEQSTQMAATHGLEFVDATNAYRLHPNS